MHGGYIEGDIGEFLDFSANIAPFGMPAGVREAAEKAIAEAAVSGSLLQRAYQGSFRKDRAVSG